MLILASHSPRRKELLRMLGLTFRAEDSAVDEIALRRSLPSNVSPEQVVEALALAKARAVASRHPGDEILAADTVVVLAGRIYGKPKNKAEAARFLHELAGHTHTVVSGVAVLRGKQEKVYHVESQVEFYSLDATMDTLISDYAEGGSSLDKAGAYGIQDAGALLIRGIQGDFYNVMGLPLAEVWRALQAFG